MKERKRERYIEAKINIIKKKTARLRIKIK